MKKSKTFSKIKNYNSQFLFKLKILKIIYSAIIYKVTKYNNNLYFKMIIIFLMTFKIIYKKASLKIINIDWEIMNKIEISQIV